MVVSAQSQVSVECYKAIENVEIISYELTLCILGIFQDFFSREKEKKQIKTQSVKQYVSI